MSDAETVLDENPVAISKEQEDRERRKARSIVSEALVSAGVPLDARGLTKHLLPGLWYAAVSVLVNLLDETDLVSFMTSRHAITVGFADNANAPPKSMTPAAMDKYVKQVQRAADTILEKLTEALARMEELEIDEWFPETVFDTVLTVLTPAWGPDHVRRAIVEQSAWFIQGRVEIRNFMEPARLATVPKSAANTSTTAVEAVRTVEQAGEHKPKRTVSKRTVSAYLATSTYENGQTGWVIVMRIRFSNGRFENRELYGKLGDPTGNKSRLHIVHEFVLAIEQDEGLADVDLKVTNDIILRALPVADEGARDWQKYEKHIWSDIQSAFQKHAISCKKVDISLVDELQQRADIILRNLES